MPEQRTQEVALSVINRASDMCFGFWGAVYLTWMVVEWGTRTGPQPSIMAKCLTHQMPVVVLLLPLFISTGGLDEAAGFFFFFFVLF